ncbi:MAG: response regulator [Myxococcota bacterium]
MMSEPGAPVAEPKPGGEPRAKILVVDDAPMFREIETVFLGRSGQILTACDGTEAFEIARRERPDLVLTDLSMREMDGDELCRKIRHDVDLRHVPVIVVTSGNSAEEHERAVRAGADGVISKPLCRVTLLQVTQRFLRLTVRSFERVSLETEVRLSGNGNDIWGWARNVSRGGMFVETDIELEPDSEFQIEFTMPDTSILVQPTARVVWRRPAGHERGPGMGLQFLKLDRDAAQWLEQYVYERSTGVEAPAPAV